MRRNQLTFTFADGQDNVGKTANVQIKMTGVDNGKSFADVPEDSWGAAAVEKDIISGTRVTTLSLQNKATRAQAATMLMRFCWYCADTE